ncbi:hypothetical protein [Vibrio minamisatsumaniensis]|uniref:hypothetical protein n=1 Tax=Vibrio minamisatsumaniensis TaxID=2910243 RepID=UPI003D20CF2D
MTERTNQNNGTAEPEKSRAVTQFYRVLQQETQESLSEEQKLAIEKAVNQVGLVAKHSVDIRKIFPWFGKRFYVVFLSGRDHRAAARQGESKWLAYLTTICLTMFVLTGVMLSLLALYLLKSALGIDLFKNFSLGIWDWFQSL